MTCETRFPALHNFVIHCAAIVPLSGPIAEQIVIYTCSNIRFTYVVFRDNRFVGRRRRVTLVALQREPCTHAITAFARQLASFFVIAIWKEEDDTVIA